MKRQAQWSWSVLTLLILLTAVAMPGRLHAGGVAILLDALPQNVQANTPLTVGFTIRSAHEGRMLQPDLLPLIIASHADTREQVTAEAVEVGDLGHYAASLTFPSAGTWHWEILPFAPQDKTYRLTLPGPLVVLAEGAAAPQEQAIDDSKVQDAKTLDNVFDPVDMTVEAGTTVIWHNSGKLPHTVTAANGLFTSGNIEPDAEWAFTFDEPGTYKYYCEYHALKPAAAGDAAVIPVGLSTGDMNMVGTIVVTAPAAAGAGQTSAGTRADVAPTPTSPTLAQAVIEAPAAGEAAAAEAPTLPQTGTPSTPYLLLGLAALLAASAGLLLRRRMGT